MKSPLTKMELSRLSELIDHNPLTEEELKYVQYVTFISANHLKWIQQKNCVIPTSIILKFLGLIRKPPRLAVCSFCGEPKETKDMQQEDINKIMAEHMVICEEHPMRKVILENMKLKQAISNHHSQHADDLESLLENIKNNPLKDDDVGY